MLIDLNKYSGPAALKFDVCIVGAGAAGITMARELSHARLRVCLIESGDLSMNADTQSLYSGREIGGVTGLDVGRLRMFGGTTNHWGGRCSRLDALDFQRRDWVPASGWPIDGATLSPYYDRAVRVAGFPEGWLSDAEVFKAMPVRFPQIKSPNVQPKIWRFTPRNVGQFTGLNFGAAYRDELSKAQNTSVFLNANLTRLDMDEGGRRVTRIAVKSLGGHAVTIEAKAFTLACGGIENARILLNGDGAKPIGNQHDLVGRYFMMHPRVQIGTLHPANEYSEIQSVLNWSVLGKAPKAIQAKGVTQIGFALTPAAQRNGRLLNASIDMYYNYRDEALRQAVKALMADAKAHRWHDAMGDFATITKHSPELIPELRSQFGGALLPVQSVELVSDLEQLPNPDNRVTLGTDRDHLGLRRSVVRWTISDQEHQSALQAATYSGAELTRLGYGRVKLEPWLLTKGGDPTNYLTPTFHYTGTTRMADDPHMGVVDKDCRVHGVDNLYVAGSSVFPTNGAANPTLTIVALACRLSDHLKAGVTSA